jgi:hypothetical protein
MDVYRWVGYFSGIQLLEDEPHVGMPAAVLIKILLPYQILKHDSRQVVDEVDRLISVLHSSCYAILLDDLNMHRVCVCM